MAPCMDDRRPSCRTDMIIHEPGLRYRPANHSMGPIWNTLSIPNMAQLKIALGVHALKVESNSGGLSQGCLVPARVPSDQIHLGFQILGSLGPRQKGFQEKDKRHGPKEAVPIRSPLGFSTGLITLPTSPVLSRYYWVGFEDSIEINFYMLYKDYIGFLFH